MIIKSLDLKNFKSFGNNTNTLEFSDKGELILLMGKNGHGKCVDKETEIDVVIESNKLHKQDIDHIVDTFKNLNHLSLCGKIGIKVTIGEIYNLHQKVNIGSLNIKVKTRYGHRKILAVGITKKDAESYLIKTANYSLITSDEHLLWEEEYETWSEVVMLHVGDSILTESGYEEIIYAENVPNRDLYDIQVEEVEEYFSNGIVSHNSSLLEAIDYSLFGKVRGKKKKYIPNGSLPNRFNNNLETGLKFDVGDFDLEVKRGINPSKLELSINNEPLDRAGKSNIQAKIDELIGIDIDTFKSFISMSVNDFKNFMTLSPDEKRLLLDKLFNLDMVNALSKIIKEKKKQNKHEADLYDREYSSYDSSLQDFKQSIEKIKEEKEENNQSKIEELKNVILSKKDGFQALQDKLTKAQEKESVIKNKLSEFRKQVNECDFKIIDYNKKIKLFESGTCPVCESDLTSETKTSYKNGMIEARQKSEELKIQLNTEITEWSGREVKLNGIIKETQQAFSDMRSFLKQTKSNILELEESQNKESDSESINHLLESVQKIETKRSESESKLIETQEKGDVIDQLNKLFSEDGIKKSIISKIVVPINYFIEENMKKLELPFKVVLDEHFSANIHSFGEEIEVDSLSSGETKLVNMAILVSYLKLIRTKKNINILFLDEVFATIDVENIYLALGLFKDFAYEYNVNIFLVHHALLEKSYFDRIIKIEKDVTSQIIEEDEDSNE